MDAYDVFTTIKHTIAEHVYCVLLIKHILARKMSWMWIISFKKLYRHTRKKDGMNVYNVFLTELSTH